MAVFLVIVKLLCVDTYMIPFCSYWFREVNVNTIMFPVYLKDSKYIQIIEHLLLFRLFGSRIVVKYQEIYALFS